MQISAQDNLTVADTEFNLIRAYIEKECGIVVGDEKSYLIESRLAGLVVETGSSNFKELYDKLVSNTIPGLREKVIDAITTNETLWFRDKTPFEILKTVILPEHAEKKSARKFRIWSCGCSTGQEPYSIAMIIDQFEQMNPTKGLSLDNYEILATDISPSVLFIANVGRYDSLSIKRGMDDAFLRRYFEQKGRVWTINDKIKKAVTFKKFNLQKPFTELGKFDVIFCRNVIIYFSDEFRSELFSRWAKCLEPNGKLFLGAAESAFPYTDLFEDVVACNGVCYRVKEV